MCAEAGAGSFGRADVENFVAVFAEEFVYRSGSVFLGAGASFGAVLETEPCEEEGRNF